MRDPKKIALYDSGIGGLTVFKALREILPNEEYLYFGDLKNMPYGEKSPKELESIARKVFDFFEKKEIDALVMACNTTSATVYDRLKGEYSFKIYPIIQSCARVIAGARDLKIGVFATSATIESHAYSRELKNINPLAQVFEIACPQWVKIVEENTKTSQESLDIIRFYVEKMMANAPDKVVLGCTHYPYLLDIISRFAPEEIFIDPAQAFSQFIKNDLFEEELQIDIQGVAPEPRFFVSAQPENFVKAASLFCEIKNLPELVL